MRTPTPAVTSIFDRLKSQSVVLTRRDVLRALCAAIAIRLRPLSTRFTALTDELARLTCWRDIGPSFAGAG